MRLNMLNKDKSSANLILIPLILISESFWKTKN